MASVEASTTYCSGPFPKPQLTGVVERTPTQPVRNLSTLPLLRKPAHGRPLPSPRSVVQSQDVRTCSGPFRDDSSQAGGHKLAPGFGIRKGSGAGSGHGMGPRNSQKGLTLTSTRGALRQKFPIPPIHPLRWGCQKSARSGPLARRADGKLSRKMALLQPCHQIWGRTA